MMTKLRIAAPFCLALLLGSVLGSCILGQSASALIAAPSGGEKLAAQVKSVLVNHCDRCHGRDSPGYGGFDVVDQLSALATRGYVVPKNPEGSKLFRRLASKSMPPRGVEPRPSDADIDLVRQWIDVGAPSDTADGSDRKILATEGMYALMLADLLSQRAADRPFIRYATFQSMANALAKDGKPLFGDEELSVYRKGFFKLINSLSSKPSIVLPVEVLDSGGSVWRMDLRDYGIASATWDRIMQTDPYHLEYRFDARKKLLASMSTKFPDVRADWFVSVASIPPFYYEILNIPATLRDLEKQLRISLNDDIRAERIQRIGFNNSGVSNFNRMIERHELPSGDGAFWISYDFGSTIGRKNIFSLPLGPAAVFDTAKSFEQDGGEMIWNLPNGLQAYMLTKANGDRLNVGPINIVSDPKRPDRQVINGLSCMHCHAEGIKAKDDEIRGVVQANLHIFVDDAAQIFRLYPGKTANDRSFAQDQRRFADALANLGIKPDDPEPSLAIQNHFEAEVSGDLAAAEVGLTYEEFVDRLQQLSDGPFATIKKDLAALVTPGGTVKRSVFAASFKALAEGIGLLTEATEPVGAKFEFTCYAEAFEKSDGNVQRVAQAKSKRSEDEARQQALLACRRLVDGLSLYDCRISTAKRCDKQTL